MIDDATIFAPATAAGKSGVAIVRISGSAADLALSLLTGGAAPPKPRTAALRALRDPIGGETLDRALVLRFPAPRSFTGEDVVELHLHGGRAVLGGVLDGLGRIAGLRPAAPGEFTRRAFDNGRLDLTEAEGLADLIAAETAAQRRQALRQMDGTLSALYDGWAERLKRALAYTEATIDFVEEEDIPDGLSQTARTLIDALSVEIAAHLADGHRGERLRDGVHVAIIGAPNAGKSSLLNRLARREAAIVSAQAGTTRDVIEAHLDLGGVPVILADTAGLREAAGEIEAEGIRRALERADRADLKIAVFDALAYPDIDMPTGSLIDADTLVVMNKADAVVALPDALHLLGRPAHVLSARTGQGVETFLAALSAIVSDRFDPSTAAPVLTRARHRHALENCLDSLIRSSTADGTELAAEDLRRAMTELGRITGRVDVEGILDVVFSEFCIGK